MYTQDNAILMRLPAQTVSAATNTNSFRMNRARRAAVILSVGDTTGTLAFKLQSSADNSTWADITGKAITPLTATDDNKEAAINIRADELPAGHSYVRAVVTPTGGTAAVCVIAVGDNSRYEPVAHVTTLAQEIA